MALKLNSKVNVLGKELQFENAYCKITWLDGNKNYINMQVTLYDTPSLENIIETSTYRFIPSVADDAPNFIKQGYEHLKTLPEYDGAIDMLEDGQTL